VDLPSGGVGLFYVGDEYETHNNWLNINRYLNNNNLVEYWLYGLVLYCDRIIVLGWVVRVYGLYGNKR
jgi:hypothetical protein